MVSLIAILSTEIVIAEKAKITSLEEFIPLDSMLMATYRLDFSLKLERYFFQNSG
jgi:hypothetical protein